MAITRLVGCASGVAACNASASLGATCVHRGDADSPDAACASYSSSRRASRRSLRGRACSDYLILAAPPSPRTHAVLPSTDRRAAHAPRLSRRWRSRSRDPQSRAVIAARWRPWHCFVVPCSDVRRGFTLTHTPLSFSVAISPCHAMCGTLRPTSTPLSHLHCGVRIP
ncbi:hypothetical protein B0H16DRAFT_1640047 [Mycena metata]|uniref:Uncharacterized protein n=1 Tax=Mycena metata TaxID=1033252 RepID=A0AAD7GR72_9AGAR|nr:hypothetical protein B0H16DRAFT_1640047 [Mycena metata]